MSGIEIFLTGFASIITALGGIEMIKYFFDWWKTRKTTKATDNVESKKIEDSVEVSQISFLSELIRNLQSEVREKDIKYREDIKYIEDKYREDIKYRDAQNAAMESEISELKNLLNQYMNDYQDLNKKLIERGCTKYDCTSRQK